MPDSPSTARSARRLVNTVAVGAASVFMLVAVVVTRTNVAAAAYPLPMAPAPPADTAPAPAASAPTYPAAPAVPAAPAAPTVPAAPAATPQAYPPPYAYPPPPAYPPPSAYPPPRAYPSRLWVAAPPPSEPGIAAAQIGLGSLTMLASLVVMGAVIEATDGGEAAGLFILVAPAVTGLMVCYIGGRSDYYQGTCAPSLVGAYVGLLTALPAAFLGCQIAGNSNSDCLGGAVVGFTVGLIAGPAAGAAIGWHMYKQPRLDLGGTYAPPAATLTDRPPPPPRSLALLDDSPAGRRGARQQADGHARLTVPLFSVAFR